MLPSREDEELLISVAASSCPPVTVAVDSIKPAMRREKDALLRLAATAGMGKIKKKQRTS